jgi:hypothetical protein
MRHQLLTAKDIKSENADSLEECPGHFHVVDLSNKILLRLSGIFSVTTQRI